MIQEVAELRSQLAAKERQFSEKRNIFDNAGDPIFICDMNANILEVNEVACKCLGYTRDEFLKMTVMDIDVPDRAYLFPEKIKEIAQNDQIVFESVHRRKDGTEIQVEVNKKRIEFKGQTCTLSVVRDISARKKMEEALRQSMQKYKSLFEQSADAVFVHDLEGNFIEANGAAAQQTGYTKDELLRLSVFDLLPDTTRRDTILQQWRQWELGRHFIIEDTHRRKDGSSYDIEVNTSKDIFGNNELVLAVVRDITGRKQTKTNQSLIANILQVFNHGGPFHQLIAETLNLIQQAKGFEAVGLRLLEGEDWPYYEQNGFTEEFLLYENSLCSRNDNAITRDENGKVVLECTCGLVLSGKTVPDMPYFTKGGSFWTNDASELLMLAEEQDPRTNPRNRCIHEGYESVGLFPVRSGDKIIGLLQLNDRRSGRFDPEMIAFYEILAQNIGMAVQRAEAEELLRQANENLEHRIAERTALAQTRTKQLQALAVELIEAEERERRRISQLLHEDLQQMLVAAQLHIQAVQQDLQPKPILSDVQRLLQEAIEKSRSLSHELSPMMLDHFGLIEALNWLARQMHNQFGLDVELALNAELLVELTPQKVFLFRAVQELLFNTVKHAGVKSARIEVTSSEGSVIITVSDQGRGFDPQILEKRSKLGLGLLTIKERASYIGGDFTIESAPGKGGCFTLTVPSAAVNGGEEYSLDISFVEEPKPARSYAAVSIADETRVLFVDDHKVMRQGLIQLVKGQPAIQVAGEASNGRGALEQARSLQPDVIVMDIFMPEMDGIEATRHIKSEMPHVRVIGLTIHDDAQLTEAMLQAGADVTLSKTASTAELLKAIYGSR